ncbi:MAG: TAXI family TRAP transporter solute-binding subunit [Nitrospinaceae bacterium]|jgi:uncharacterized protein|nr:TAXI family TRAP transporter solute-binding subunit [Nitrospinaceae bacterium]MBT3434623.1 TAXI family TRAP transporter solute-binding subunit [Nitrospinaceae bacterium]MBT3823159.1 TAXI family TRAP transporter solute-binding subunit [Nitrospinaceae bacterium]MBT4432216.1 TAXI family TRAP transporter solute-binding subunit [Nitrospinaceae bacterium]MBT5367638.1 TAXI family TRAP transporter solute-binding subunit [Nitrospinaceae bacterium]
MSMISKTGFAIATLLVAGLFAGSEIEAAKANMTIAAGGKGSGGYRLSGGLAEAVNRVSDKVNMTVQPTGGFVANTRIIGTGRTQFAMSSTVFLDFIRRQKGPFKKNKEKVLSIRAIGPVATSWFQLVVPSKSKIKSYNDMLGKRVNLGKKGSGGYFMANNIVNWMGIKKKIQADAMSWGPATRALVDGKIDVFMIHNPVPSPHVLRASRSINVRVLDMPESLRDKFEELSPGYSRETVDASVYKGMKGKKFKSISHSVFLVAHKGTPNDIVYEVTRHTYTEKSKKFLTSGHKAWKFGLRDAATSGAFIKKVMKTGTPMHPGAMRFWKEKGYSN